jgi:hypothetical protein
MAFVVGIIEYQVGDIVQRLDTETNNWHYWSTIQNRDDAENFGLLALEPNYRIVRGQGDNLVLVKPSN